MHWPTIGQYQDDIHRGTVLHEVDSYKVIDCNNCGFKHMVPLPSVDDLKKMYRETYYTEEKPRYFEHHAEDQEWWKIDFKSRLENFDAIIEKELPRTLLDVGSGPGYFALAAQEAGWEVTGIEPSVQASAYSKNLGLNIINRFFDQELVKDLDTFSVVHLSEVLEHVPNPKTTLELCREKLSPGGAILVRAPNDYNPVQLALTKENGFDPWWVVLPHHINYFDFDSLTHLLQEVGFEVVRREATFPIDMFLLMGENYIRNEEKGREVHGRRKQFEITLEKAGLGAVRKELLQNFADAGLGRNVLLYGRKP